MQTEEIVFDVTSESHNLEFNKSGGYHAYPKHNRKDFYFLKSNQDLIKQGISMDIFNVKLELTESDILKYFKNKFIFIGYTPDVKSLLELTKIKYYMNILIM